MVRIIVFTENCCHNLSSLHREGRRVSAKMFTNSQPLHVANHPAYPYTEFHKNKIGQPLCRSQLYIPLPPTRRVCRPHKKAGGSYENLIRHTFLEFLQIHLFTKFHSVRTKTVAFRPPTTKVSTRGRWD